MEFRIYKWKIEKVKPEASLGELPVAASVVASCGGERRDIGGGREGRCDIVFGKP